MAKCFSANVNVQYGECFFSGSCILVYSDGEEAGRSIALRSSQRRRERFPLTAFEQKPAEGQIHSAATTEFAARFFVCTGVADPERLCRNQRGLTGEQSGREADKQLFVTFCFTFKGKKKNTRNLLLQLPEWNQQVATRTGAEQEVELTVCESKTHSLQWLKEKVNCKFCFLRVCVLSSACCSPVGFYCIQAWRRRAVQVRSVDCETTAPPPPVGQSWYS